MAQTRHRVAAVSKQNLTVKCSLRYIWMWWRKQPGKLLEQIRSAHVVVLWAEVVFFTPVGVFTSGAATVVT